MIGIRRLLEFRDEAFRGAAERFEGGEDPGGEIVAHREGLGADVSARFFHEKKPGSVPGIAGSKLRIRASRSESVRLCRRRKPGAPQVV